MRIGGHIVRAAAWMVAIRWCIRGLDVVVMVVLARLLVPEDFGLYATGILVVGLLEIISQAGIDLALIRNPATQREHYDAAWTIQIIQGVAVALVLLALAPLLAGFFDEPRTVQVAGTVPESVIKQNAFFSKLENSKNPNGCIKFTPEGIDIFLSNLLAVLG